MTNDSSQIKEPPIFWGIWVQKYEYFKKDEQGVYYCSTDPNKVLAWIQKLGLENDNAEIQELRD